MRNIFLLLFAACVSQVLSLDERGCKGLMELIITIDGSDSINAPDYRSLRDSMARLVQSLDIRESEIRLSFVVYSSGIAFRRNLTGDKDQLLYDAKHLPHPRDGTKTSEAIAVMRDIASKRREGVPVIGLVLTDGISKNQTKTKDEAFLIKQDNVTMYAIGISRIKDFTELNNIASGPNNVVYYKSFQELAEQLSSLVKLVCPKCPPNPLLKNSDTVQGSYIVDDTISYHCKPDFVPVGNNTITCQRDQTWTKLDYACLAQCGPPPVIDKTELVLPGNLEGSKTQYKCSKNTVLKGSPETECKEDGTWSEPVFECIPDCGLPGIIPRATLSHGSTLEGTIRTYTCASNTVAQGDPNIVCQKNGQWSKTKVYCRPDCGEPMAIDRADLVRFYIIEGVKHLLDTLEGTRREYRCRENTVQEGDNKILCSSKGTWIRNGPPLYCRPDCGKPPVIQRSKVTYTGTLEKQTATYVCDRNTVTEGETQIVCQLDGRWSATSLYCRPDCGEPKIIERATISKGNNLEGTRRRYTCNPKTVSEGITEILCGKNGRWSDIDLYCRRKSSSSESSEENGTKDEKSDSSEKGDNSLDDSDDGKKSNGSDDNSTDKSNDKSVKRYENSSNESTNDDSSDKSKNNSKNSSSKNKSSSNSEENSNESKDKNTKNTNESSDKNKSSDSSDKSDSNKNYEVNVSDNNSGTSGSSESDDSSSNDDAPNKSYTDRKRNNDSDQKSDEKNDRESDVNSDDQYNGDKGSDNSNENSREAKYNYNIQSSNTNSNSNENNDDSNDNSKSTDNQNDDNYKHSYLKTRTTSDESNENSDRSIKDNRRKSMQRRKISEEGLVENFSDEVKSSESKEVIDKDDLVYVQNELKGIDNAVENSVKQLKDDMPDSYESTEESFHENNEDADVTVNGKRTLPSKVNNYARNVQSSLIFPKSKQNNYQGNDNTISLNDIVQGELSKVDRKKNEKDLKEEWQEFVSDGWLIDLSNFLSHDDNYDDDDNKETLDYEEVINKEKYAHRKNTKMKNNEQKSSHIQDNEEDDDIESDADVDYVDMIKKEIQEKHDHSEKKHDSSDSDSYESEEEMSTLNGQPATFKGQPQNEDEEPDIEGDEDYDYIDAILKTSGKLNPDSKEASNQPLKDSAENSRSDESDNPFDNNFHQKKTGKYKNKVRKSSGMSSEGSDEDSSSGAKSGESKSYKKITGNEGSNSDENESSLSESSNEKQDHVSLKKNKDDELNNSIRKLDDINAYLNYNDHQSKKLISDKDLKKSHGFTHELDEPSAKEHINLLHSILLKSNVDDHNELIKNGLDEKD